MGITVITKDGGGAVWGGITGTLADQTDLQSAIDAVGGSFWDETQTLSTNSTLTDVTTPTEVSGFSFDLEANSTYMYKGEILMSNGDVAVGLDMYMTNKNSDNLTNWAQNGLGVFSQTSLRQRSSESASISSKFFFNESGASIDAVSRCFVNGSFTTGDNTPEMILTAKLNGSSSGVLTFYKGSFISFKKVS